MEIEDGAIKKELVLMLKDFDKLMLDQNLNYSIMSGTLLGAVRHKGFIPWDDDVDVAMLRNEYQKFVSLIKSGEIDCKKYRFIGFEIGNDDWPFLKMINPSIKVLEKNVKKDEYLWIDIFPFDHVKQKHDFLSRIGYLFKSFLHYKRASKRIHLPKNYTFKNWCMYYLSYVLSDKLICRMILFSSKASNFIHKNSKLVKDVVWGTKPIPRYLFDDLVDYQFENITVKGFKDYDTYLTCIYGDYMKLPPEDQRVNHGIKAWRVNSDEE